MSYTLPGADGRPSDRPIWRNLTLPDGTVIPPTGKAFDLEFGQTTKWDGDQLVVISAFWDSAAQARQLGLS